VLTITIVGIAAIPFLVFGLFCAMLFGKAVVLATVGRRCTPFLSINPPLHTAVGVLVGGVIVLALYTIPIVGFLMYHLVGVLGLGVVIYTILLAVRASRNERARVSASVAAAPGNGNDPPSPGADPGQTSNEPLGARASPAAPAVNFLGCPRAGFWIRMGALVIDAILVGIVLHWLRDFHDLELIGLGVYGAVMWKLKGTTVGGVVCNLKVVRLDGREIDWPTAVVRALGCFLSLAVIGLGFFWIVLDADKQSWHDKIAGTVVVRVPKGVSLL
jgi:uncharacterized RDD family membrane protein YckC